MNKSKLIALGAGVLGSIVVAAFSTGVARDAVTAFCAATVTPEAPAVVNVQPTVVDAGAP